MKIAFPIVKALSGSDVYFQILAEGLKKYNITAEIIELSYSNEFIPITNRSVRKKLQSFDLIHSNIEYASLFKLPSIPLVSTLHHNVFDKNYQKKTTIPQKIYHQGILAPRIKRGLQNSSALICVSNATAISYEKSFGSHNYKIIHNGIDTDTYKRDNKIAKNSHQLIMVGKLSHRKGKHYIKRLMDSLGQKYQLSLVTKSTAGSFEHNNITTLSNQNDQQLIDLYNKSGFVISLSSIEGFGYSLAEGMACGCAVVSWDNSAIPELCTRELSGKLVEEGSIEKFSQSIVELSNNPQRLRDIEKYNSNRIFTKFSTSQMITKYIDLYQEILCHQK